MSIVQNKKASHDYSIEERFEAGLALEGWEVKAIRAGRVQIQEAFIILRGAELFLIGCHITPLPEASTHVTPDPTRTRKLLMHTQQIDKLVGKVERAGYTLVPLDLHYTRGRIKLELGLAKGKRQYDKRAAERGREWTRGKERLHKAGTRRGAPAGRPSRCRARGAVRLIPPASRPGTDARSPRGPRARARLAAPARAGRRTAMRSRRHRSRHRGVAAARCPGARAI